MTIHNWSARRSGGRITIYGECHERYADGSIKRSQVKITGVDAIVIEGDKIIAIDRRDVEHELGRGWVS